MSPNETLRALGGEVGIYSAGGVMAKVYGIPAKTQIEQHVHTYDHLSILISGKAHFIVEGEHTELNGPAFITVEAGKKHTIIAETDSLLACIHNEELALASEL